MSSRNRRRHNATDPPRKGRGMRIVPDRRDTVDHLKLARALLHLAQAEYDALNPDGAEGTANSEE